MKTVTTAKKAPAVNVSRWTQLGRREADQHARVEAGLDGTLREAAKYLLSLLGEDPEILAEGWMEQHGTSAPIVAFAAYQDAYLSHLREMAPRAEA